MIRQTILALALVASALLASSHAEVPAKKVAAPQGAKAKANASKVGAGHHENPQEMLTDIGEAIEEEGHGRPAHDGEGNMEPNILELRPSLMATTIIVFGTLLFILYRLAWGPLTKALDDRERHQDEILKASEHARSESERLLREHRLQMEAAAEQVRQLLEDGRKQADANANMIVEKARTEAEAESQRAKREIGAARDQALVEIWSKAADTAVSVAGKVLSKEMNSDDHRRLVAAATKALPAVPAGANGHGGHAG